jgi:hypothetical protein
VYSDTAIGSPHQLTGHNMASPHILVKQEYAGGAIILYQAVFAGL